MARKRYKAEEIVSLLRHAEVLHGQGMTMADAIRQLGVSEVTYYRWRKEYGGGSIALPVGFHPAPGSTPQWRPKWHPSTSNLSTSTSSPSW